MTKPPLRIALDDCTVRLEMRCPDHDAAIALFDQVIANAHRAGVVTLVVESPPRVEMSNRREQ